MAQFLKWNCPIFLFVVPLVPLSVVVDEAGEDTETGATDLAPSRAPALGPLVPGLGLHFLRRTTDAGVVLRATRTEEEQGDTAVVVLPEGLVTTFIDLHALVLVHAPLFVVAERGHFLPDDARPATLEADMAAGEGQGATRCVRVGHVRGHTLVRKRGLGPCHTRVIQDIREAGLVVGPSAEEEGQGAGAEAEMIFETAGQGRRGSCYTNFQQLFCSTKSCFLCLMLYSLF